MGNQSSIYIHLDQIDGYSSRPKHYDMEIHNEIYRGCIYFKKVTFKITYHVQFPTVTQATQFYLLFTKRTWTVVNFTYYPYSVSDVIDEVYCFYSVLRPDEPLVLGFKTRDNRIQYYRYMDLDFDTSTGLPPRGFDEDAILYNLKMENQKLNKKLTFLIGSKSNVHINGIPGEEDPKPNYSGRFKRVFRKANTDSDFKGHRDGPWAFYSSNIFTLNRSKNKIDDRFLWPFNNKQFYAIYVYYTYDDEIAILIELAKDFNDIIFIARRDMQGNCWERIDYKKTNDTEFDNHLQFLERDLRNPWLNNRGPCKKMEYKYPGPVDFTNCDPDYKKIPAEKPRGTPKTPEPPKKPVDERPEGSRLRPESPTRAPPHRPETRDRGLVEIDLSITSPTTYGRDRNITVSDKTIFDQCKLFCYFTHTVKTQSQFSISSIRYGSSSTISIDHIEKITKVKSVSVFFNIYEMNNPLVLKIHLSDGTSNYYTNLIQSVAEAHSSTVYQINERNLVDELIYDNFTINKRISFQFDQIKTYNRINVEPDSVYSKGYTVYKHSNDGYKDKMCDLFLNKKPLIVESDKGSPIEVQNKKYEYVNVYALDIDESFPLIIELKGLNSGSQFFYRKDVNETLKQLDKFSHTDNIAVEKKLNEVFYLLKKSLIIEIGRIPQSNRDNNYELKLIENAPSADGLTPSKTSYKLATNTSPVVNIKISDVTNSFAELSKISYKCFQHLLPDLSDTSESKGVGGLRLYYSPSKNFDANPVEVYLYKTSSFTKDNQQFLFYTSDHKSGNKDKFYVYYYNQDLSPLFLFYNERAFKKSDDSTKWISVDNIKTWNDKAILNTLKATHTSLKKKLIFVKQGSSTNLRVLRDITFGKYRKDTYSSDSLIIEQQSELKLPKNILIGSQSTEDSNIETLFENLYDKPFDTVNVYTNQTGSSLQDIILIEFIYDSHKIHIKRKDKLGNYWVEELVPYGSNEQLQKELQSIENTYDDTIVYEIDKTVRGYSRRVSLYPEKNDPIRGFNKYIHMTTTSAGITKKTLILFNDTKLIKKEGAHFRTLEDIENKNYNKVTVFTIADSYNDKTDFPLLIELNTSDSRKETNIYYYHRRKNTNYFWDKTDLSYSFSNTNPLIDKLNVSKFELFDSIVLLMDKTNEGYGDSEIKRAIHESNLNNDINLADLDVNNIKVNKARSIKCFSKYGYQVYQHEIGSLKEYKNYGLRFYILESVNGAKYVELSLFDYYGQKRDYLYHSSSSEKVYFYFYGDDPRPLLLFYGDKAYRANSRDNYHKHNWFRDDRISDASCQFGSESSALIHSLSEVVAFLNPVNLEKRVLTTVQKEPNRPGPEILTYDAYKLNVPNVSIKVSYENKSCYRVYSHESNGFRGSGMGYRLGTISYGDSFDVGINYSISKQLIRVSVYYSLFDFEHKYPLLVSLRFYDNSYEYYEFSGHSMSWSPIEDEVDESEVEKKAYKILENLKIELDRKNEAKRLFKSDDCKEGGNTAAVIGGSVGGVVSTAAVGGGVTVAVRPELILTSLKGLL